MTEPLNQETTERATNHNRSRALGGFTLLLILAGVAWFCYWYFYLQYYESTDDAYANGNFINVNSVISGAVVAFYADNTDLVKEGQLLVELDRTNYEAIYRKELATLASVTLHVRQLYDTVETNRANVRNKRAELERTRIDYNDRLKLLQNNPAAVAREDFINAEQAFLAAQFNLQQAESQLEAALSAAGNTAPANHPLIMQQRASILTAYYDLQHCSIYASQTGYVAQRSVDVGEWITPTTNLLAIIPTNYVWVDANFKETQLGKMRIGQPAVVWFDLYGSKVKYEGKVIGIASGTGSVFSLIPPQNATGNWIKIVQRLPVRISLDEKTIKEFPLRLGISAEVDVNVTNQNLPLLATTPPEKPVAITHVFDIHLEKVDQMMDKIIHDNLYRSQSN
jgi:membrane fusion protein (multidrug efflux system)